MVPAAFERGAMKVHRERCLCHVGTRRLGRGDVLSDDWSRFFAGLGKLSFDSCFTIAGLDPDVGQ